MGEIISGHALFSQEAECVIKELPSFSKSERDGVPFITGNLILTDEVMNEIDRYEIEILSVEEYPNRLPHVFEIGGQIPRNIDWHIFESDGHCCLMSLPNEILVCKSGITLRTFIEEQVKPFFFNQLHRKRFGYFLRERSHGIKGELEFFSDLFGTPNITRLYELMRFCAGRKEPSRTATCFCGRKEKYRRCHRNAFRTMTQFSDSEMFEFIYRLGTSEEFRLLHPELAKNLENLR